MNTTANGANKKLVLHVQRRCGSLSIITTVSHLANERIAWQLSIKFCIVYAAMNGCKILKIH